MVEELGTDREQREGVALVFLEEEGGKINTSLWKKRIVLSLIVRDSIFMNEMYWETISSSPKSRGAVMIELMWLLERMKTTESVGRGSATKSLLIADVLHEDADRLDDLHLRRVRSLLVNDRNDIAQELLLQEEATRHPRRSAALEILVADPLAVNKDFRKPFQNGCQLLVHPLPRFLEQLLQAQTELSTGSGANRGQYSRVASDSSLSSVLFL